MKKPRMYVSVAGGFKIYTGTDLDEMVEAIWSHLSGYGRVWVRQKDETGSMMLLSVRLDPVLDRLTITNEGGSRWEPWVERMSKVIRTGPTITSDT